MIALELGIAFVAGVLIGAILMALAAARGNDELHVENARLRQKNRWLGLAVRRRLLPDREESERWREVIRQDGPGEAPR